MGLLDSLPSSLLDLLRSSAAGQNLNAGLGGPETASYAQAQQAPFSLAAGQQQPQQIIAPNQPRPLDAAQRPSGPIGAPPGANAAMPSTPLRAPLSMAPLMQQPPAASQPEAPSLGDRLMTGLQGFIGNLHHGPIGAVAGGVGALATGQRTDPGGIAQQREQKIQSVMAQALRSKGIDEASVQAAFANPEVMKTLVAHAFGPKAAQTPAAPPEASNANGGAAPLTVGQSTVIKGLKIRRVN